MLQRAKNVCDTMAKNIDGTQEMNEWWMNVGTGKQTKLRLSAFVISYHLNLMRCDVTEHYTNQTKFCNETCATEIQHQDYCICDFMEWNFYRSLVSLTNVYCSLSLCYEIENTIVFHTWWRGNMSLFCVNSCVLFSFRTQGWIAFVDCAVVSIHANVFFSHRSVGLNRK